MSGGESAQEHRLGDESQRSTCGRLEFQEIYLIHPQRTHLFLLADALTRIDRHSTLAVQVSEAITTTERAAATTNSYSENTFWLDGHLETISSSCVKGWASSHHQYPMSGTKPV